MLAPVAGLGRLIAALVVVQVVDAPALEVTVLVAQPFCCPPPNHHISPLPLTEIVGGGGGDWGESSTWARFPSSANDT